MKKSQYKNWSASELRDLARACENQARHSEKRGIVARDDENRADAAELRKMANDGRR